MKKSTVWIIVIIIILLLVAAGFFAYKWSASKSAEKTATSNYDSSQVEISMLNDSISTLNTALEDCPKYKKRTARKATTPKQTPTPVTTPAPQPEKSAAKPEVVVPADNPSRTENTGLCGDQYVGIFNGSHGVTINEDSQLVYFISNEELNAGEGKMTLAAPQLNGKNSGKEFYWDASRKLWVYESNTIITIARLLGGQPIVWCVYLGDHQQWGYPMFTPHEIVKTGSSSVRSAMTKGEVVQHSQDEGCDYHSLIQFKKK